MINLVKRAKALDSLVFMDLEKFEFRFDQGTMTHRFNNPEELERFLDDLNLRVNLHVKTPANIEITLGEEE